MATGTSFVAATNRYQSYSLSTNRGVGYACELAGSSLGALLGTTILLPLLGLELFLILALSVIGLTLVGAVVAGQLGR
jgi:hypothetical protein